MSVQRRYSPGYKDKLFYEWYAKGKPAIMAYYLDVEPENEIAGKPSQPTLLKWWREEWQERAEVLDLEVKEKVNAEMVASKVEMLQRHAETGKEMQEIAMAWLQDNKGKLTPGTAVRMLVDGVEMERATAGIPAALEKMMKMSDEDVKDELAQLIADSEIDGNN